MTKKEDALTVLHGIVGSATTEEVAAKIDSSRNTAQTSLSRLAAEGRVEKTADGRWHVK